MAKNNNLQDFLTDIANAIRTKTQTTEPINAQDFSDKILSIQTGGGGENTLKNLLDATMSASSLFYNYSGTTVEGLIQPNDTENVINMDNTFGSCHNLINIPQLNTSNVNSMLQICYQCSNITTIPLLDTSKVTLLNNAFNGCLKLVVIPALDVSKVKYATNSFAGCTALKSILMTGMKVSFDISASTKFERADLLIILNNLATVTSTKTLTMGSINLAKLTDEDKAIATNKGWTLA